MERLSLTTSTGTLTSLSPSVSFSSEPPPDNAPQLPSDLVIEILYWLPVKSLLQFRCVCKSWNSLISDDTEFAKKHLHASITRRNRYRLILPSFTSVTSSEFVFCESPFPSVTSPPECTTTTSVTLKQPPIRNYGFGPGLGISSCDGIICCAIDQSSALVFNPSIRKIKLLPHLEIPHLRVYGTLYSFGYHRFTKSYRIVAVSFSPNMVNYVSVHTLGTDFWRKIEEDFPSNGDLRALGTFVSDTVNWLTHDVPTSSTVIISLDLNKESYHKLLQPDYDGMVNETILSLGVLRDCLCILSLSDTFFGVWLMKEYGNEESWTKLFSLPYMMEDIGYFLYIKVVYISEDDQVLLLEILMPDKLNLLIYECRNGTSEIPKIQNINGWMTSQVCIESLISPLS